MVQKVYGVPEIRHRARCERGLWSDHLTAAMLDQEVRILERIHEMRKFYKGRRFGFLYKRLISLLDFIEHGTKES